MCLRCGVCCSVCSVCVASAIAASLRAGNGAEISFIEFAEPREGVPGVSFAENSMDDVPVRTQARLRTSFMLSLSVIMFPHSITCLTDASHWNNWYNSDSKSAPQVCCFVSARSLLCSLSLRVPPLGGPHAVAYVRRDGGLAGDRPRFLLVDVLSGPQRCARPGVLPLAVM